VDHLLDIVDALERQGVPLGRRVGLLSNTAALGASLRGAADQAGLEAVADNHSVPLSPAIRLIQRAFTSMAAPGHVDVVIAGILAPPTSDAVSALRQMAIAARPPGVVHLGCLVSSTGRFAAVQEAVRADGALPPLHATPYAVSRAAAGMLAAALRPEADDDEPAQREDVDPAAARAVVERWRSGVGTLAGDLGAEDLRELLGAYGIGLLPARRITDAEDGLAQAAGIGYPVALKSTDPELRHRADLGGVRLGIPDEVQLRHAVEAMRRDLSYSSAPLEVQAMAPAGVPMVVRSVEDP